MKKLDEIDFDEFFNKKNKNVKVGKWFSQTQMKSGKGSFF